ncbi:hypothetical protein OSTOST_22756 [Ostertagia ostertagi]
MTAVETIGGIFGRAVERGSAILISANAWQCVCGEEWLGDWLEKAGDSDVGDGVLGCLVTAARRCAVDPQMETDEVRSVWVTVTASILAAVSLLILIAIAFLYITDGKQRVVLMRPLTWSNRFGSAQS